MPVSTPSLIGAPPCPCQATVDRPRKGVGALTKSLFVAVLKPDLSSTTREQEERLLHATVKLPKEGVAARQSPATLLLSRKEESLAFLCHLAIVQDVSPVKLLIP